MTVQVTLKKGELDRIIGKRDFFKKVQDLTGVPWEAIAALWYREASLSVSTRRPGGPFQFDPADKFSGHKGRERARVLLQRFTTIKDPAEIERLVQLGVNNFEAAAILAACWFRKSAGPVIHPEVDDEAIKDGFYGYNGRKYGSVDKSPYVMNGIDEHHYPMRIRGSLTGMDGKREWVNTPDYRAGAYVVYKLLCSKRKPKGAA